MRQIGSEDIHSDKPCLARLSLAITEPKNRAMKIPKYVLLFVVVSFSLIAYGSPATRGDQSSLRFNNLRRNPGPLSVMRPNPRTISETVASLRAIKTESDDVNVPEPAKPLLMRLKRQLRDLIHQTINQDPELTPEYLQQIVLSELAIEGINIAKWPDVVKFEEYVDRGFTYGDIDGISIQRPEGHPDLLAVTTTVSVCCGEDTSFYLFQNRKGKWDLILALESNYYDQIRHAQAWFQYAISSNTVKGGFFVVVGDVAPWCTSNWHTLHYRVLRPSQRPYNPKVLMSGDRFIFVVEDQPYKIGIGGDTFSLEFIDDEYMRSIEEEEQPDSTDRPDHNTIKFKVSKDKIVPLVK
jgi:hypothetical protein